MTEVIRRYHPDGSIAFETTLVDGVPHGVNRRWHANGILAEELPLNRGVPDGVGKQWNEEGELLHTFEIKNGTGVQKYHSNGIIGQVTWFNGKWTGPLLAYFEDGELCGITYWLENRKVSRKVYVAACKLNPELPSYRDPLPPIEQLQEVASPGPTTPGEDMLAALLQGPRVREALIWLEESLSPSRSLGEASRQEDSIRLVKKLYELGAMGVHAIDIDGGSDEDQNSGKLVIELSSDNRSRAKLLRYCGRLAREQGFDAEKDVGQKYTMLMLD